MQELFHIQNKLAKKKFFEETGEKKNSRINSFFVNRYMINHSMLQKQIKISNK